jgi:hypothetical protein
VTPLLGPVQFIEFGLAEPFLELNLVARHRQSAKHNVLYLFYARMGRSILADADRIMRPNVEDRLFHQRCQADRATRIVGEDQKSGREGPHAS